MKKTLFFLAAIAVMAFTSCQKPDPTPSCWNVQIWSELNPSFPLVENSFWGTETEIDNFVEEFKNSEDYAGLLEEFHVTSLEIKYSQNEKNQTECADKSLEKHCVGVAFSSVDETIFSDTTYYWVNSREEHNLKIWENAEAEFKAKNNLTDCNDLEVETTATTEEQCAKQ